MPTNSTIRKSTAHLTSFTFLPLLLLANTSLALQYQASVYGGGTTTTFTNIGQINFSGETDQLNPTNTSNTTVTWGLAAALRSNAIPDMFKKYVYEVSLGPEFFYLSASSAGDVWQYTSPAMNNLTYDISTSSYRLLGTNEITFQPWAPHTFPFFEWGLGFAANQSSYAENPRSTYASSGITLAQRTQYNFAYTLGGGLKIDITKFSKLKNPLLLTFRYLYTNLGSADVSNQSNSLVISPITVSLDTQTWVAGLTYLF